MLAIRIQSPPFLPLLVCHPLGVPFSFATFILPTTFFLCVLCACPPNENLSDQAGLCG